MEKLIPTNEIKYQKLEKNEENKIEEINTNLNNLSFFNKFFFIWAFKTIKYAYKKNNITVNDLNNLPSNYQSNSFYNKIYDIWENKQYKNIKKFPLLLTSIKANFSAIFIIFISTIFNCLINILSIYYFRLFVQQFITESSLKIKNLKIGLIYLSIRLIDLILQRKSTELLTNIGNKSAVELNCLVYNKLLKLSPSVEINSGKIINFIQNDSHKLFKLMSSCPNILSVPFLIIMYNYLLFKYMGISFVFGFLIMVVFMFVNHHYRKEFSKYLKLHTKKCDARMKVTSETFNNLKVIKLYGWDDFFLDKISFSRKDELDALNKRYQITQISQTLLWLAPIAMSVFAIGAYQFFYDSFKIEDMFTCLGIFTSIQNPMKNLPVTIDNINETIVSLNRIEKFLKEAEINKNDIIRNDLETIQKNIVIKIQNGNFSWGNSRFNNNNNINYNNNKKEKPIQQVELQDTKSSLLISPSFSYSPLINSSTNLTHELILKNINLEIKKGEFVCIIGEVGSGKSSLLQAILNNMEINNPVQTKLIVNGEISYVSQEAWIQNSTVRNNILFYHPYEPNLYNKIIELCELKQDLEVLVGGDLTEIGEKGINLSGGQKARISLARAMYTNKDIFILDDPISALDANVGQNIMKNCIVDFLKNKTRILVTHALQYLKYADQIVYIENGEIKWKGTFKEIQNESFYRTFSNKKKEEEEDENNNNNNNNNIKNNENDNNSNKINKTNNNNNNNHNNNNQIKRITKDESKEQGTISSQVYFSYFSYIGGFLLIANLILILISWQVLRVGSDIWLGYWSDHQNNTKKSFFSSNLFYFLIYAILSLSSTLFNYFRTVIITSGSLKCSSRLHTEMIKSLIFAPINLFHDTIPKGQIFNRLSKDLTTVDTYTMYWFMTLTSFGTSFFGAIVVCSLYQPYSLILLPFFLFVCWKIGRFYMNCSRELTRIEGMLNSPILNLINETIPGNTTIRAYNFEDKYINNFYSKIDNHFKVEFYLNGISQWYLLTLNFLSFIFLAFIVIITLINKEKFSAKIIGLLLTYSIVLQEDIIEFLSAFSNFENTMTKMERCLSYTNLISERPHEINLDSLMKWPTEGSIEFIHYSVQYRPGTEIVLKNLNFVINGGEHIGIVGRTGSGKSTIALCLFRILEPLQGKIIIDGIDIGIIGLKKLRRNLTIIPQDSTVMNGTLRYNIDPIKIFSDEEIKNVLNKIGFNYIIDNNPNGLDQIISENGNNLSIGEKQLICITRAILRKSKIIIMDEATASIDYKTEEIIQHAINELLKNSTVITIAHRIKTILNSDKIIVLENGNVVEYDSPKKLLSNKNSFFYSFYSKSI